MPAAESCATMAPDGINFVNEDDAWRILLALFKKIAYAACAYADKHLYEVRTGNREEWNVRFTGNRTRKQGLAGARRPDEQDALGNSPAQFLELLWVFQELNNFLQLFLGLVRPGDVLERGLLLLRGEQPRTGLAKAQCLVSTRLHLPHQEQAEAHKKNQRRSVQQDQHPVPAAHFLHLDLDGLVPQRFGNFRGIFLGDDGAELLVLGFGVFALELVAVGREVHGDFLDLASVDLCHQQAIAGFVLARLRCVCGHQLPEHHAQKDNGDPKQNCFCRGTRIHVVLTNPATCPKKSNPATSSAPAHFSWASHALRMKAAEDCALSRSLPQARIQPTLG